MTDTTHPNLAHQFDDLAQQREADTLGMWAFLATEVLFFGALFTAIAVNRIYYTEGFYHAASEHMQVWIGAINTGVLLVSSYTVAMAVHSAHENKSRHIVWYLLATIGLALIFLGLKVVEYSNDWHEGIVPGLNWTYTGEFPAETRLFMSFYFIMTAIHALHMLIGIGIFAIVTWQARRGRYSREYYNPVEISGLYWHFVDIVWIFLFPTLYLLR
jgi:cytochrome c oxidase subunit 3